MPESVFPMTAANTQSPPSTAAFAVPSYFFVTSGSSDAFTASGLFATVSFA